MAVDVQRVAAGLDVDATVPADGDRLQTRALGEQTSGRTRTPVRYSACEPKPPRKDTRVTLGRINIYTHTVGEHELLHNAMTRHALDD